MSTEFKQGHNIVPQDHERDPSKFTKADSIQMPHEPSPVKPLPKPDSVSMDGDTPAPKVPPAELRGSAWPSLSE